MKKLLTISALTLAFGACTSVERATVAGTEIAADGEAVAVVQASAVGLTAIFHLIDIVPTSLDQVVNELLVTEAKAMGATKIQLVQASTTPQNGIFALTGGILGFPLSHATGIAIR